MTGRQSTFTQEVANAICERIANGESLRAICRDDDMPGAVTVCKWLDQQPNFAKQYARAREIQGDGEFDEARAIAFAATPETAQVARLQYDAVKWRASKLRPKVYGDKLAIGGADDLPPVQTQDVPASQRLAERLAGIERRITGGDSE